jgi:ribose 5-phosphate isomerase B
MKIAIGSDHAGFDYKKSIIDFLVSKGHEVEDFGTESTQASDYPDYAIKVAESVRDKKADFGILICGTGIGMSIAANKVKGIRAAVVFSAFTAESSKSHNHANVITFGSRTHTLEEIYSYINIYMSTNYSEAERHVNRVNKISKYEE